MDFNSSTDDQLLSFCGATYQVGHVVERVHSCRVRVCVCVCVGGGGGVGTPPP